MTEEPKKQRGYKKIITVSIFFAILIVAAILIWRSLQQPANGTINAKTSPADSKEMQAVTYKKLEGKTFTLEYPSSFSAVPKRAASSYTGLDNFLFSTTRYAGNDHLAISVYELVGPLAGDSSFRFRTDRSGIYTQSTPTVAGGKAYVFSKTDGGYEKTVFIPYKNVVAVIALTAGGGGDEQDQAIAHVLSTFSWHLP